MPIPDSQTFTECKDTEFQVAMSSGPSVPLVLAAVTEGNNTSKIECFSILFRGPLDPLLPQATYRLSHSKLEPIDLFLVPVGPNGSSMQYEAIVNRFREPQ